MPNLLDTALQDFPRNEIWRLQTDGWQACRGPDNFRPSYYQGMEAGFNFLRRFDDVHITPEFIEHIYFSAYQYESAFKNERICRQGYCESVNEFAIVLPLPGLEAIAGVSLAGIDELVTMIQSSYESQGSREFPQNEIGIMKPGMFYSRVISFNDFTTPNEFKNMLIKHLELASATLRLYAGPINISDDEMTRVDLISNAATREEILTFVQNDIGQYYTELQRAQSIADPEHRKASEIMAINRFIRKLHQSHYFPDGNGRTFIFLLANLLHLQNGHGLKITEYPAHYAGFSSYELLIETRTDLDNFNAFKITKAKEYFGNLSPETIIGDKEGTKRELTDRLNPNPLIALAQIDELFIQVLEKKIQVPMGHVPSKSLTKKTIKSLTGPSTSTIAHDHAKILLKELYLETLVRVVQADAHNDTTQRLGYGAKTQTPVEILRSIVFRHDLAKACGTDKIEPIITQLSNDALLASTYSSAASSEPPVFKS